MRAAVIDDDDDTRWISKFSAKLSGNNIFFVIFLK